MTHYLDNSATTPLCDDAKAKMLHIMNEAFGNPSSLHSIGAQAQEELENARKAVLTAFLPSGTRGKPEQIIFTSGGTEANNLALIGTAQAKARNAGKKIIVGEGEHSSVLSCAKRLEDLGFTVAYIPSPRGVWDMETYRRELTKDTILVSAMLVNNETGAANDIASLVSAAKEINPDIVFHCDAVQGFMRSSQKEFSRADLVSVSAHKIGGPKGAGALFVSEEMLKKRTLSPIIFGGGQERGLRSGTENVIGICGFGAAVGYYLKNGSEIRARLDELYKYAIDILTPLSDIGIKLNIPKAAQTAHHIISVTAAGVKSETMLHFLSSRNVFVSSGSACSSNTHAKSSALKSFGLSDEDADSTVRFSFGVQTTRDDIDAAAEALCDGMKTLSRKRK